MNFKKYSLIFIIVASFGFSGCAIKNMGHPPAIFNLDKHLDSLYHDDYSQWKIEIEQCISSGDKNLPSRHLVHAIKEFNDVRTIDQCLDATFLYLSNVTETNKVFNGPDLELFSSYVEYVLSHPNAADYTLRLKHLCRSANGDICKELHN
jgi:hypothetical protein